MAEFRMPSLGADMDEGTVIEWLVKPGDVVHKGDPVAVVDTDKAAIEVETFAAGTVDRILVPIGERVQVGTPLATINGTTPPPSAPADHPKPPRATTKRSTPPPKDKLISAPPPEEQVVGAVPLPPEGVAGRVKASPYARKLARALGVELAEVPATGHRGLVTSEDVRRFAESDIPPNGRTTPAARTPGKPPEPTEEPLETAAGATAETGTESRARPAAEAVGGAPEPMRGAPEAVGGAPEAAARGTRHVVRKDQRGVIARLMVRAAQEIPHYYLSTTVDLGTAVGWLARTNRELPVAERLVPAALLLKATALAARRHPELNGYWIDDGFRPAEDVHLGVAISLRGGGLVAPALHGADSMSVRELMTALRDLVERARSGRLRRTEMTEATLTITNLGDQGVESVHGIIYPPQVALVGAGRIVERPWAVDGLLGVRPCLTLTLAADHRATDGFTGGRFLTTVDHLLQTPEEL